MKLLNGRGEGKQKRRYRTAQTRVIALLDGIHNLFRLMQEDPEWHWGEEIKEDEVETKVAPAVQDAFDAVNRITLKYPSSLMFVPRGDSARKWTVRPSWMDRGFFQETIAIHAILGLADDGLLERLKKCDCGLWYFARFSHQRFCSEKCRVKFWEASEVRKEKKREQARANYLYRKVQKARTRKRG